MNCFDLIYPVNMRIATEVGVNGALMLNNLHFWVTKNMANNKHFHEGKYWTYNSQEAFTKLFPCWTRKQIRTILDNLKKDGYIETGTFNKIGYDRTTWYTLTEKGWQLMCPNGQMSNTNIGPNGPIEVPKGANRNAQTGQPIPDNKPDNKPDIYIQVKEKYNLACKDMPSIIKITETRKKQIDKRLKEYDLETILKVIEIAGKSDFLSGRTGDWKANFDWIMKPANFIKILEGNYTSKENKQEDDNIWGNIKFV